MAGAVTGDRQAAQQVAMRDAVRAELDRSIAFLAGCKQLPRRQRRPRVGDAVRDYLADQIAWRVVGYLDGFAEGRGAILGDTADD